MILRIWRTVVDEQRVGELERFERDFSAPMFRRQEGCLGFFFLRSGPRITVVSLWRDARNVKALSTSASYLETTRALQATGLLKEQAVTEELEVGGGFVEPETLKLVRWSTGGSG